MNFSRTTEYAFRVFAYMAKDDKRLYRAVEIYQELHIPYRYLRKLLTSLTKSELLNSIQGMAGGYMLSRELNQITLWDIYMATTVKEDHRDCFFGFRECALDNVCSMHDKWFDIQGNIKSVLQSTDLQELKRKGNFISTDSLLRTKND
jgi:Rrf2 family protein